MRHTSAQPTVTGLLVFLLLVCPFAPAHGEILPRPAALDPAVTFWTRVYTEIDDSQGFVHDDRDLSVVYGIIDLPAQSSRAAERQLIKRRIADYRDLLLKLAATRPGDPLVDKERRMLELWGGAQADRKALRAAAEHLRFQRGLANRFRDGLIRSGRWKDYIVATFREQGVPTELAALPHVESSFHPGARSHVGASGLWQFTSSTGRRFMRVDHVVDERLDPYKATVAAARLLKHNYGVTGSWPLAITAYNHGVAGMRRAQQQLGTDDIATIIARYQSRSFGFASRNFYPAFLAALDVSQQAERYFGRLEPQSPVKFVEVRLPAYLSVDTVSQALGLEPGMLRSHNPDLREPVWSGEKYLPKGYPLKLPAASAPADPGRLLASLPSSQRYAYQKPDREYRIQRGDTLSLIAARYNTTVGELAALNPLRNPHRIRAGEVLRLPTRETGASPADVALADGVYTVQPGDTLGRIAGQVGTPPKVLLAMNALDDADRILAGQRLVTGGSAPPPVRETAAVPSQPDTPAPVPARPDAIEPTDTTAATDEPAQPLIATDEGGDLPAIDAPQPLETELLADPSDYSVAADGSIEVQAEETLGHYAEWLGLRANRLRQINHLSYGRPVIVGKRIRLDFNQVDRDSFEALRRTYHRGLQAAYFADYRLAGSCGHTLRRGDSLWSLSHQRYQVPMWLLRQYNPDIDFDTTLPPGSRLEIPVVVGRSTDGEGIQAAYDCTAGRA